ncbi:transcriptional regulator BetI [Lutibaculum baratangense]|uniref:HTH-type transcriptional regulator BetI n=1 Tax=Lutibaculum baratangense AMV1 TaxID=631454 RepID=V4RFC2_9HYPH|nr:transcriptional regulator BetI [Lutibaculum baratangense]ESR24841.1 HTH-type transcriptional regulator BetI [Lutibaculum baratangense AMV1]
MPKVGVQPIRRRALIGAAIEAIHDAGFCEVTMGQIARRAGVSPALAHHYFGSKEQLLAETMRHLLSELGLEVSKRLAAAPGPRARVSAIIAGNFDPVQFTPTVISAWLAFYLQAQTSERANRLLRIYALRLKSNLQHELAQLTDRTAGARIADGTAALIDGLWIRHALRAEPPDPAAAIALVEDYVDTQLKVNAP